MSTVSRKEISKTRFVAQRLKRLSSSQEIRGSNPPKTYFYRKELISKKGNITNNDKRLESHPSAEDNHPQQAEVMQFSYQNTGVANIRSVFSTIHRSTTSASNSRLNIRQREQIKAVRRSVILTEVNGEQPSDLSSCGLASNCQPQRQDSSGSNAFKRYSFNWKR